jgi:hypothetical protein
MGDKLKGAGDSMASTLQPQSEKSTGQKMTDTLSSNQNENQACSLELCENLHSSSLIPPSPQESLTERAKNAVGLGDREQ